MKRLLAQLLEKEHFAEPTSKMAFVVGPRQCGKTTLARALQQDRGTPDLYRNWDDLLWRKELSSNPYGFLDQFRPLGRKKPLAVLDEIHKFPRWKQYLKGLWDTRAQKADILVTGSGRLDVYKKGGDSLLGRYHQYRLHPLSVSEVLKKSFHPEKDTPENILKHLFEDPPSPTTGQREVFDALTRFSGFPEPFLRQNERAHRLWLRERRDRLIREDLRDLTRIQMLSSVEQMVELIVPRVGTLLSLNNLRNDLGVSFQSTQLWMEQLERLYWCYRIRPYAGKLSRALAREPKLYLYDWTEIPEPAIKFENMVACALLRWCHFTQDWGQEPLELRFMRDKEKREVDFLLIKNGKPFLLIETKLSETKPTSALDYFSEKLGKVPKILLVSEITRPGISHNCLVLPATSLLSLIP